MLCPWSFLCLMPCTLADFDLFSLSLPFCLLSSCSIIRSPTQSIQLVPLSSRSGHFFSLSAVTRPLSLINDFFSLGEQKRWSAAAFSSSSSPQERGENERQQFSRWSTIEQIASLSPSCRYSCVCLESDPSSLVSFSEIDNCLPNLDDSVIWQGSIQHLQMTQSFHCNVRSAQVFKIFFFTQLIWPFETLLNLECVNKVDLLVQMHY